MDALAIIGIGAVAASCLILQIRSVSPGRDLYEFVYIWDFENKSKLTAPFYFGLLVISGGIIYGLLALMDPTHPYIQSLSDLLWFVGRCIIFCSALVAKAYLSPTVLGFIACYSIYSFSVTGEAQLIPIFEVLLDWVFFSVSKPMHVVYVIVIGVYSLGISLTEVRREILSWESS